MPIESGDRDVPSPAPVQDEFILTELDQIKVLADPLRIRILEELQEERTTKQVAERIGEKPTKLYHHVDSLLRVGLIQLTRTNPNRGTLEKYYQAVARSFRADERAFSGLDTPTDDETDTLRKMIGTIFGSTSSELMRLIESGCADSLQEDGIVSFVEIRAGKEEILELQKRLHGILEWLQSISTGEDDGSYERYRLTLAYFPLDPATRAPSATAPANAGTHPDTEPNTDTHAGTDDPSDGNPD